MSKAVRFEKDIPMKMRDGITLMADIFRPDDNEKHPAIVVRTPYDKTRSISSDFFTPLEGALAGYAVIIQDLRGRFASEGEYLAGAPEGKDGYDTIENVAAEPWCDGNVGMAGASYLGLNQWHAAIEAPPHLKAIAPHVIGSGPIGGSRKSGVIGMEGAISWSAAMAIDTLQKMAQKGKDVTEPLNMIRWAMDNIEEACKFLPLKDLPFFQFEGLREGFLRRFSDQDLAGLKTEEDLFWPYHKVEVPCMHSAGWYDISGKAVFDNFLGMGEKGGTETAREGQHVFMGPWIHGSRFHNLVGGMNFGRFASGGGSFATARHIAFFDKYLRGIDSPYLVPIRYFVMGLNRWRNAETWPLPKTQWERFYFHSRGHADSSFDDGLLSRDEPGDEPPDRYIYDPLDPFPTNGGQINPDLNLPAGPLDQSWVERRSDVLCYSTPELKEDMEVTGPVTMHLFASTSVPDTDFMVRLVDVYPNGKAINVAEGCIRARYRKSILDPEPITPGETYEYTIDMAVTSNVFKKGHHIRVHIASSDFPRFDRNMNTGNPFGEDTTGIAAMQTIFHTADYASYIELPVIPG